MMNETKIYQTTVQTGMAIISVSSCCCLPCLTNIVLEQLDLSLL